MYDNVLSLERMYEYSRCLGTLGAWVLGCFRRLKFGPKFSPTLYIREGVAIVLYKIAMIPHLFVPGCEAFTQLKSLTVSESLGYSPRRVK